jgi:hypothetical protein
MISHSNRVSSQHGEQLGDARVVFATVVGVHAAMRHGTAVLIRASLTANHEVFEQKCEC